MGALQLLVDAICHPFRLWWLEVWWKKCQRLFEFLVKSVIASTNMMAMS